MKKGEESVTYVIFFQVYLIHFSNRRVKLSGRQKLFKFSLFSASNHPGNPSRPGSHSNSAHLPLAEEVGELGRALGSCWASMRTWNQSQQCPAAPGELGSGFHSNRLQEFVPILVLFRWIHLPLGAVSEGPGTPKLLVMGSFPSWKSHCKK